MDPRGERREATAVGPLRTLWHRVVGEPVGLSRGASRALVASQIGARLRARERVTDREFDALFPPKVRAMSAVHWTPVRVAALSAELLARTGGARFLDVGSGAGKLCAVASLTTGAAFVGVEQYAALVECARETAGLLGATGASFVHGRFRDLDPADYDGFYFFNPFEENDWKKPAYLDPDVPVVRGSFAEGVEEARCFLAAARPGTRVVTFNGMGGPFPPGYRLEQREKHGCTVDLWCKDARPWAGASGVGT
jgi:SAM-dependent methyltransferase